MAADNLPSPTRAARASTAWAGLARDRHGDLAPMEPPPAPLKRLPWRRSTFLAALLGWVLPGLGQLYVGRPRKALLFLLAILPTFVVGWALTDFTIVNPSRYGLDFVAQVFLGGPVLAVTALAAEPSLEQMPRFLDAGRLYVQVAGLLNLVAMSDAIGEAIAHNLRVLDLRAARREAVEDEARRADAERSEAREEGRQDLEERKLSDEARDWPVFGPHPVREPDARFEPDDDAPEAPREPSPSDGGPA